MAWGKDITLVSATPLVVLIVLRDFKGSSRGQQAPVGQPLNRIVRTQLWEETSGRRDSYLLAWSVSLRVSLRLSPRERHCPHVCYMLSCVRLFAAPQTVACQAGPSVRGLFQARTLKWVALSYSTVSSWPRNWAFVSCVSCPGGLFSTSTTWEALPCPYQLPNVPSSGTANDRPKGLSGWWNKL